jgi:hypothetical protein
MSSTTVDCASGDMLVTRSAGWSWLWWLGLLVIVLLVVFFVWWVWNGGCATSPACCPTKLVVTPAVPPTPAPAGVSVIAADGATQTITATDGSLASVRAVAVPDVATAAGPPSDFRDVRFSVSPDGNTLTFIMPAHTASPAIAGDTIAHLLPAANAASTAAVAVLVV